MRGARESLWSLLELLLPRRCAGCGAYDHRARPLCEACSTALLALVAEEHCPRCGSSLGEGLTPADDGCRRCPTPMPRFERLVRLGRYEGPLAETVRGMKFHNVLHTVGWLARMLAQRIRATPPLADLAVVQAVPLYWTRRLRRGYNQAERIAAAVARELDLPLARELVRVRNTPPQVHLPRSRRLQNVRGAFRADGPRRIVGRHVLLIDDVTTTGATAGEAARALLDAGAARVSLAVLAKADPPAAFAHASPGT